jgi:hypothetical protein
MKRREFLKTALAAAIVPDFVLDTHLHLRADPDACFTHMQGCGVTHAVLLTRLQDEDKAQAEMLKRP